MRSGVSLPALLVAAVAVSCAGSEPVDVGGAAGTGAGVAGTGGSVVGPGGRGGAAGAGVAGAPGGRGGSTIIVPPGGRGGAAGVGSGGRGGGAAGRGGAAGTGTIVDAGAPNPDAGPETFTYVYNNVLRVYCSDRNQPCHNPGSQRGVSFSTQALGYTFARRYVEPGNSIDSWLYYAVDVGYMPPTNPLVPADLKAVLAAWIDAGALNN